GQGQRVGLVEGDMRRLPFADARFDAVLNLFNAFGYLEDDAQDELVLAEVARVLAPGGRFLQELANRAALIRGWRDSEVVRTDGGLVVLQERTLDLRGSRELTSYTLLHPDGRRTSLEHAIRLYTLTDLAAMLGRAGLELLEVSGDLDGGPLELDSAFLVTVSGGRGGGSANRRRPRPGRAGPGRGPPRTPRPVSRSCCRPTTPAASGAPRAGGAEPGAPGLSRRWGGGGGR